MSRHVYQKIVRIVGPNDAVLDCGHRVLIEPEWIEEDSPLEIGEGVLCDACSEAKG